MLSTICSSSLSLIRPDSAFSLLFSANHTTKNIHLHIQVNEWPKRSINKVTAEALQKARKIKDEKMSLQMTAENLQGQYKSINSEQNTNTDYSMKYKS